MASACEMIQQGKLCFLRVSFLIAGHTKFSPDLVFSKIAQSYNRSDVFNTIESSRIISQYADVIIDDGDIVCDWRNPMNKYSKLPGIRSLHDFVFTKNSVVVAKVQNFCYVGPFQDATESVIPDSESKSYKSLGKLRSLSESKRKHLEQMSKDFIPNDRWLPFLTEQASSHV